MDENNKQNQINIELNEETGQGTYSNLVVVVHSSSEFVLDFVRYMPGLPKAKVQSRIILTPENAKRLLGSLQDNIAKFESTHGPIKVSANKPGNPMPMSFGGPTAQA